MTFAGAPLLVEGKQSPRAVRRLFLIFTLAMPFILLIAVELLLRIIAVGPDVELFTTVHLNGHTYRTMNPHVKARYFNNIGFNPATSPGLFQVPKPPKTFRIFCLGGSTTVGFPYWYNGAFSSFLRGRLSRVFPSHQIEIMNVGMTATNSFTVLDIARDLVDQEPDLFIVYDGHNEFYGALGAASREGPGNARWLRMLYLRLIRFKTFLLLREVVGSVATLFGSQEGTNPRESLMEQLARGRYVTYGSPLYAKGLEEFKKNLDELRALCIDHSIPLILSSQVSNLCDLAPFNSGDVPGATGTSRTQFNQLVNTSLQHIMDGQFESAVTFLRMAESYDTLRAETQFLLAQSYRKLGKMSLARIAYTKARDYDRLRFRTSSDFNDAIRKSCDNENVFFADIESAFMTASPDSLVGSNLLFEHVHPRTSGAFLMAKTYARIMHSHGILASIGEWASADTIDDQSLWDDRSLTPFDEILAERKTEILTSGWPFQTHTRSLRKTREQRLLDTLVENIVRGSMNWEEGHVAAAEYFRNSNDTVQSAREYLTILSLYPRELTVDPFDPGSITSTYSSAHASYFRLLRTLQQGNPE